MIYKIIFLFLFSVSSVLAESSISRPLRPYCAQEMIDFMLERTGLRITVGLKVFSNANLRLKAKHLCATHHYLPPKLTDIEVTIYEAGKLQSTWTAPEGVLSYRKGQLLLTPSLVHVKWKTPKRQLAQTDIR